MTKTSPSPMPDEIFANTLNGQYRTECFRGHVKYIRADLSRTPGSDGVGAMLENLSVGDDKWSTALEIRRTEGYGGGWVAIKLSVARCFCRPMGKTPAEAIEAALSQTKE